MPSDLADFVARHERIVLQFSAGKDSAACLKLLRPHWDKVLVLWVNPGRPYRETLDYMDRVRAAVPHFHEEHGHQPEFIERHGWPADSVPFEATPLGRTASRSRGPRLVHVSHCCGENLWAPMTHATVASQATGVVRGEKACDQLRSPIKHGDIIDGLEYCQPVYDWSDEEVLAYLGDDVPPSYRRGLTSSLDCATCTAYSAHNPGRLADLRRRDPEAWREIEPVVLWMRDQAREHSAHLMAF